MIHYFSWAWACNITTRQAFVNWMTHKPLRKACREWVLEFFSCIIAGAWFSSELWSIILICVDECMHLLLWKNNIPKHTKVEIKDPCFMYEPHAVLLSSTTNGCLKKKLVGGEYVTFTHQNFAQIIIKDNIYVPLTFYWTTSIRRR